MIGKIDVRRIVKDHWDTLVHDHSGKYSVADFFIFYGVPVLIGALLLWFGIIFGKTVSGVLSTAFSIFAALLFNLLILIFDIMSKANGTRNVSSLRSRFLRQIYSNISYTVLISIILVVLLLLFYLALSLGNKPLTHITVFLVYTLSANFILTILMVLKRVHILLSKEFESPPQQHATGEVRKSA